MLINNRQPAVIALGMFDGVHLGHRALLHHAVDTAKQLCCKSVAYTFSNHPKSVFGRPPKLLSTAQERTRCILKMGVDDVRMEIFDRVMASMLPQTFIGGLMRSYDIRAVVIGFNYAFGQGGQGNAHTLQTLGREHGFDVHVIEPVVFEGDTVSSTRIRELIERGDLNTANAMLCMPYTLTGQVVENRHIGASIGFPTANILPPEEKALPKPGVYITTVMREGIRYAAVTNVGKNPTVAGRFITVETHILDFFGDLYGEELSVEFHERLRDEVRFPGRHELAMQIEQDASRARAWLSAGKIREIG